MLDVDTNIEEKIIDIDTVGYGSGVAKKILTQLKDHVDTKAFNEILSNLDEMKVTGDHVKTVFKHLCGHDYNKFIDVTLHKDKEMYTAIERKKRRQELHLLELEKAVQTYRVKQEAITTRKKTLAYYKARKRAIQEEQKKKRKANKANMRKLSAIQKAKPAPLVSPDEQLNKIQTILKKKDNQPGPQVSYRMHLQARK